MISSLNKILYLPLILLLFAAIPVCSQTSISIPRQKITIRDQQFYISEIIDARSNKEMIGIVQRGLKNRPEAALFQDGLQDELKKPLVNLLQPQDSLMPLIMRGSAFT